MSDLTEFNSRAKLKPGSKFSPECSPEFSPEFSSGFSLEPVRRAGFWGGFRRSFFAAAALVLLFGCAVSPPPSTVAFDGGSAHGYLYLPRSAAPHPVVIDLHDCGGIQRARNRTWLVRLLGAGFAVLQVDSLTRRGVADVCADEFRVAPIVRSMDAASALRWVVNDPRFRRDGVFLFGATASLLTQLSPGSVFSGLRGVVAFHPDCYDELPALNADLLVFAGGLDARDRAGRCLDMRIGERGGHSYELVAYPGVHRGGDAAAARDGIRRVLRFLQERI